MATADATTTHALTESQRAEIAEARRLIRSGAMSIVAAGLASGAALAASGPHSGAFILASAIGVLAVLRTGQGIRHLRTARARAVGVDARTRVL